MIEKKEVVKERRERMKTEHSQNVNKKVLFEDKMQRSEQSLSPIKKSRLKT